MTDPFRGLTKGDQRALSALGVERLEAGEVSKSVRVRASAELHEKLRKLTAKEIGNLLEQALS